VLVLFAEILIRRLSSRCSHVSLCDRQRCSHVSLCDRQTAHRKPMRHSASYFPGFCIFLDNLQGSLYYRATRPNGFTYIQHHNERKPQYPIPRKGCEPTILTFEQQKTKESYRRAQQFTFNPPTRNNLYADRRDSAAETLTITCSKSSILHDLRLDIEVMPARI
jgi:hypothetical protein